MEQEIEIVWGRFHGTVWRRIWRVWACFKSMHSLQEGNRERKSRGNWLTQVDLGKWLTKQCVCACYVVTAAVVIGMQCSDCWCVVAAQLLTSAAVHRWGIDIQEGIFDMLQLLIDLIATRLRYEPVPVDLLHVLAMVHNEYVYTVKCT